MIRLIVAFATDLLVLGKFLSEIIVNQIEVHCFWIFDNLVILDFFIFILLLIFQIL